MEKTPMVGKQALDMTAFLQISNVRCKMLQDKLITMQKYNYQFLLMFLYIIIKYCSFIVTKIKDWNTTI